VTKSVFLAKGNLAILFIFTKENNNRTKDKIDPQHLHLQGIKSIFHGDVGFILAVILCFHNTGCLVWVSTPELEFDLLPLLG